MGACAVGSPHNVLFVLTDDQAYDAVHSLGWHDVDTPNLDRLVRDGVTFTHAYNQGSWTGAVCIASRTMLFTGQYLWHAHRDWRHLEERYVKTARSWPQRMQAAGYRTCLTGKWHVNADPKSAFEDVRHVRPGMPKDAAFMYDRPHPGVDDPFNPADPSAGGYWEGGQHWSEVVADDVIAMLPSPEGDDRPFFVYAAFNAPHDPRQSPARYVAMYPHQQMSIPDSFLPRYPFANAIGAGPGLRDERLAPFPRTEYAVQVHRAEYAAIISHLDAQIGRILKALDELQLTQRTRIVLTSDHGLAVGRHGLMGKQNMYDHSVRVPLVLSGTGLPRGERIKNRVYLQDVVATTLGWAGADTQGIEFRDLMRLVGHGDSNAEDRSQNEAIYGAYLDRQRMITSGNWKLIVYPTVPTLRLYHLADDPHELVDLASDAEHRPTIRRLLGELRSLQQQVGDELELPQALGRDL